MCACDIKLEFCCTPSLFLRVERKEENNGENKQGYVSPKTGSISSGGREEGRRKVGEREQERQSEVC